MGLAAAMGALGVTGARFTPLLMTRNELVITGVAIAAIAVGVALAVACPPLTGLFFVGLSLAGLGIAAATKVALSVRDFHAYIDGFLGEMGPDGIGRAGYGALETASLVLGVPKELLGYIIRKNAPEDISATNDRQGVGFVADALATSVLGLKRALAEVYPYHSLNGTSDRCFNQIYLNLLYRR